MAIIFLHISFLDCSTVKTVLCHAKRKRKQEKKTRTNKYESFRGFMCAKCIHVNINRVWVNALCMNTTQKSKTIEEFVPVICYLYALLRTVFVNPLENLYEMKLFPIHKFFLLQSFCRWPTTMQVYAIKLNFKMKWKITRRIQYCELGNDQPSFFSIYPEFSVFFYLFPKYFDLGFVGIEAVKQKNQIHPTVATTIKHYNDSPFQIISLWNTFECMRLANCSFQFET